VDSLRDCFQFPDTCEKDEWCELNDHKSWNESETTTMGRCVKYQVECASCIGTFKEEGTVGIPGLDAEVFVSSYEVEAGKPLGTYADRRTLCHPDLVCTDTLVPSLPATCVPRRKLPQKHDKPTKERMYEWGKRMLRMGARNLEQSVPDRGPRDQEAQGAARTEIHAGVNKMLSALWNPKLWGTFEDLNISSTYGEKCCTWTNYSDTLSEFQQARTHASFRNPLRPQDPVYGNSPPCVWCEFDGAYNDENPSIWSLIHALTFNLDGIISEYQLQVLSSIPLWLRQHLSCPLCRSHVKEHLIDLGVPRSRFAEDWARFFWIAHNYVNEQSEVTRCGSQSCGWGVWTTPPAYKCAGVYRYPWFMPYDQARLQWRMLTDQRDSFTMV
jgi:hypothetical protein